MSASHRPKKVLAFDWDAHRVRVVSATLGKRGPRIERLLSVAIPSDVDPTNAIQMGGLLRRILDQERIGTTHAIVDIPRDQAILNTLTLPAQVPDELPAIVAMQISKQLPFAVGDAVIDFTVGQLSADGITCEVLVAAVRHEVLKHYESVIAAAGLKLIRVGLRPFANKVAACELLKHALPERVLLIDVGPILTEINVLRNGFLAFSRAASVSIAEQDAAEEPLGLGGSELSFSLIPADGSPAVRATGGNRRRADTVSALAQEVTVSIEAYRASDHGARMDHVVVVGDTGVEEALSETLQQKLQVTSELYNPGSTFGWEPDEGVQAAACAAALGLVLGYAGDDALQFDFLHPKKTVSVTGADFKKAPLVAAVVALFLIAGGVALATLTKDDRAKLTAINRKIAELQTNATERQKFLSLTKEIRDFDGGQLVWVDLLYDITANLPPQEELMVTQVDCQQKERKLVLKTRAKKRDTTTKAARNLSEFKRDGKEFEVNTRALTVKEGENYPFSQDLVVMVRTSGKTPKKPE